MEFTNRSQMDPILEQRWLKISCITPAHPNMGDSSQTWQFCHSAYLVCTWTYPRISSHISGIQSPPLATGQIQNLLHSFTAQSPLSAVTNYFCNLAEGALWLLRVPAFPDTHSLFTPKVLWDSPLLLEPTILFWGSLVPLAIPLQFPDGSQLPPPKI